MSDPAGDRLERTLAPMLSVGTWLATFVIALGIAAAAIRSSGSPAVAPPPGRSLVTIGVALFIALPVLRVVVMFVVFVRQREARFAVVAALVLVIIAAGVVLGVLH